MTVFLSPRKVRERRRHEGKCRHLRPAARDAGYITVMAGKWYHGKGAKKEECPAHEELDRPFPMLNRCWDNFAREAPVEQDADVPPSLI